jgi:hypothetical protein
MALGPFVTSVARRLRWQGLGANVYGVLVATLVQLAASQLRDFLFKLHRGAEGSVLVAKAVALESSLCFRKHLLHNSDWASADRSRKLCTPIVGRCLWSALGPSFARRKTLGKAPLSVARQDSPQAYYISRAETGFRPLPPLLVKKTYSPPGESHNAAALLSWSMAQSPARNAGTTVGRFLGVGCG